MGDVLAGLNRRWTGTGSVTSPRNMSAVLNPTLNAGSIRLLAERNIGLDWQHSHRRRHRLQHAVRLGRAATITMIAPIPPTEPPPPSTIGPDEVNALIARGEDVVIVDVRNARILDKQGWITMPSATLIPLEELETRAAELPKGQAGRDDVHDGLPVGAGAGVPEATRFRARRDGALRRVPREGTPDRTARASGDVGRSRFGCKAVRSAFATSPTRNA